MVDIKDRNFKGAKQLAHTCCSSSDYNVVIVGGGLSGLVAAYTLKKKSANLSFCILEADNKCGGQISTKNVYDMGARWFSAGQHHLVALCEELKVGYTARESNGSLSDESSLSSMLSIQTRIEAKQRSWDIDQSLWGWAANFELKRFLRYVDVLCTVYAPEKY